MGYGRDLRRTARDREQVGSGLWQLQVSRTPAMIHRQERFHRQGQRRSQLFPPKLPGNDRLREPLFKHPLPHNDRKAPLKDYTSELVIYKLRAPGKPRDGIRWVGGHSRGRRRAAPPWATNFSNVQPGPNYHLESDFTPCVYFLTTPNRPVVNVPICGHASIRCTHAEQLPLINPGSGQQQVSFRCQPLNELFDALLAVSIHSTEFISDTTPKMKKAPKLEHFTILQHQSATQHRGHLATPQRAVASRIDYLRSEIFGRLTTRAIARGSTRGNRAFFLSGLLFSGRLENEIITVASPSLLCGRLGNRHVIDPRVKVEVMSLPLAHRTGPAQLRMITMGHLFMADPTGITGRSALGPTWMRGQVRLAARGPFVEETASSPSGRNGYFVAFCFLYSSTPRPSISGMIGQCRIGQLRCSGGHIWPNNLPGVRRIDAYVTTVMKGSEKCRGSVTRPVYGEDRLDDMTPITGKMSPTAYCCGERNNIRHRVKYGGHIGRANMPLLLSPVWHRFGLFISNRRPPDRQPNSLQFLQHCSARPVYISEPPRSVPTA
ncbi:hypothetical protein J6590_032808 [Homalodisca vitripennis]|nr:hypothetical protein J6590_032808 [Homalodisca vitripennis]